METMPVPARTDTADTADTAVTVECRCAPPHRRLWAAPGSATGRDAQFVELLNGYRRSGGLARAGDVCLSMRPLGVDMTMLARWIAARELLHFEWQGAHWLPLFQFGGSAALPRPAVAQVLAELADVMAAWELAQWFAEPNSALAGCCPADRLHADAPAVLQAARADRYLIDG